MPDNQESPSKELDDQKGEDSYGKELLTEMRSEVILTHVATMPIPLYERMKEAIKQLTATQQALDEADRRAGAAERELSRRIKELCSVDACSHQEGLTLENLQKAIKTLRKPRFVFSPFMEKNKIIGMKEGNEFDNYTRPAFEHEEPDYYVCNEETYNDMEYKYHCNRLGIKD
jgi:hypothetical protein